MLKNKKMTIIAILSIAMLLSISIGARPSYALISQNTQSWFWNSDTNVASVATGDVNGDGQVEIVTAGYYNSGSHWIAQLVVWNGTSLAAENVNGWYWGTDTQISSVAVANITGGSALDIVTGGSYFDGTRWNAQLCVWNGSNLALESVKGWYWNSNTYIWAVGTGNISGTGNKIITAGSYSDGSRDNAQLIVWDNTLTLNNIIGWYWTGDTHINSIAVANITGGAALSIVTGGSYFDGTRNNAQLVMWNGSTLASQGVYSWVRTSDTTINSVAVGNYSGGSSLDIITGGEFNDGTRVNAQLIDYNGASFALNSATNWFTASTTSLNSVAIGNFGSGNRVVTGGSYYDLTRANAQVTIWG